MQLVLDVLPHVSYVAPKRLAGLGLLCQLFGGQSAESWEVVLAKPVDDDDGVPLIKGRIVMKFAREPRFACRPLRTPSREGVNADR